MVVMLIVEGISDGGLIRQRCFSDEQADRLIRDLEEVATKEVEWTIIVEDDSEIDPITGHRG